MKKYIFIIFSILLTLFGGCSRCKKEIKPDPCAGYKPMSADFKMTEKLQGVSMSQVIEVDTVLEGNLVAFEANQDLDSYEWKIGSDPRVWNTKKFSLSFFGLTNNSIFVPTTVNITLKGRRTRKEIDTICNPNSTIEEETLTKKLVVVPYHPGLNGIYYTKPALVGRYEGFEKSEPNKKYVVEVGWKIQNNTNNDVKYMYFTNLIDGCDFSYSYYGIEYSSAMDAHYTAGYSTAGIPTDNTNCRVSAGGEAILFLNSTKDSIIINYSTATYKNKTFKGKRIN